MTIDMYTHALTLIDLTMLPTMYWVLMAALALMIGVFTCDHGEYRAPDLDADDLTLVDEWFMGFEWEEQAEVALAQLVHNTAITTPPARRDGMEYPDGLLPAFLLEHEPTPQWARLVLGTMAIEHRVCQLHMLAA